MTASKAFFTGSPETQHRPHRVTVKLSEEEHATLARISHELKVSASEFIRSQIKSSSATEREETYKAALEFLARGKDPAAAFARDVLDRERGK